MRTAAPDKSWIAHCCITKPHIQHYLNEDPCWLAYPMQTFQWILMGLFLVLSSQNPFWSLAFCAPNIEKDCQEFSYHQPCQVLHFTQACITKLGRGGRDPNVKCSQAKEPAGRKQGLHPLEDKPYNLCINYSSFTFLILYFLLPTGFWSKGLSLYTNKLMDSNGSPWCSII